MTRKIKLLTASMLVLALLVSMAACGVAEHPTETTQPAADPTTAPTTTPTTAPTTGPTVAPTLPAIPDIQANIQMEQVRMSGYHENWIAQFQNLLGENLRIASEKDLKDVLDQIRSLNKEFTVTGEYDAGFFLENVLVLIPVQSTSGSVRFVAEAEVEAGVITISVVGKLDGVGTTDMADWLLLAALPRAEYPEDATIDIKASAAIPPEQNLDIKDR